MTPVRDLDSMISQLLPHLRGGRYVFATAVDGQPPAGVRPVMTFIEDEGLALILEQSQADAAGVPYDLTFAWITLRVHSALDGVGLTAAVSTALADAGISCNVVAATHHDHIFVPIADAQAALAALDALRRSRPADRDAR
jgi:hypothetical protein